MVDLAKTLRHLSFALYASVSSTAIMPYAMGQTVENNAYAENTISADATEYTYVAQPRHKPEAWKGMKVKEGLPPLTTEYYNPTTGELNTNLSKEQATIINDALWNLKDGDCFARKPHSVQLSNATFKPIEYNNIEYFEMLALHEQSKQLENKYHSCNKQGYAGRWQLGTGATEDTDLYEKRMDSHVMWDGTWTPKAKEHGIHNIYDLMNSEPMQKWAVREYTQGTLNALSKLGTMGYASKDYVIVGKQGVSRAHNAGFESISITEAGLAAAAHNIGAKTLNRALDYGEPNKKTKEVRYAIITKRGGIDANGSSGLNYLRSGQDVILLVSKETKKNPHNGRDYTHFSGMSAALPSITHQDERWTEPPTPQQIASEPEPPKTPAPLKKLSDIDDPPPFGKDLTEAQVHGLLNKGSEIRI